MDIFNRPPAISEDTLQYTLYPPHGQTDRAAVTALAALFLEHTSSLLPGHLWHRDSFELKVVSDPEDTNGEAWVLEGRMRVGDCIDDEWCAVWLLRQISSKWDVVISVFDSDGEFLLIEAAEVLPSWVTPSNAENRVWIHNSHLHLLPLSHVSAPSSKPRRRKYPGARDSDDEGDIGQDNAEYITARDAVKLVREPSVDTVAPNALQEAVWKRITGYPDAARQHIHVTRACLPVDIAKVLAIDPTLVQKPVETFYTRDALQLRAAHKMARFPPQPSVLVSVKMTRTAYAQLVGQKFHPPKIFGRWSEREGTPEWRWKDIGMKIACGFEMSFQESKSRKDASASFDGSASSADALKDALRRNPDYGKYVDSLKNAGYFKGELQGSQVWNDLENQAASAFVAARQDDDASRPSFAAALQKALREYSDAQKLPLEAEDPDDWLNVDAADFDTMLEKNFGGTKEPPRDDAMDIDKPEDEEERVASAQAARLQDLAKKVGDFVEGQGDVDGARFADETFSDDDESEDDNESDDLSDGDSSDPEPAEHRDEAARAERQAAMDRLVPGIDPSEYGKMPASFHSNSQRVAPASAETDAQDVPLASADSTPSRPIRAPILQRDNFDGVDSDDESDEDEGPAEEDDEDEHPHLVGEVEIDMADEQDEFLEFARQALGMSDDQWGDILRERAERGAFVPKHSKIPSRKSEQLGSGAPTGVAPPARLESFEAVMQAMDDELSKSKQSQRTRREANDPPVEGGKGKQKATEDDVDIEEAMEAELRTTLHGGDGSDDDEGDGEDYELIKNFLESFKSQGGLSGPVSTLVGRLQQGWVLPRDDS